MTSTLFKKPKKVLFVATGILVLAAAILAICYFALWRPTDSDYAKSISKVAALQAGIKTTDDSLASIAAPANVTPANVSSLSTAVNDLQKSLDTLSSDKLIVKNTDAYAKLRDSAAKYESSVQDTVTSLQQYLAVISSCTTLVDKIATITTTTAFTAESADCTTAINTAKQAPGSAFTDQYLTGYTTNAELLLTRYKNLVTAKSSAASKAAVAQIQQRIILDRDTVLNLTIASDTDDKASQLTTALNQQKASFLR